MTRPVALVTGASSGIGAAFVDRLAATHDVVLVARSGDRMRARSAELEAAHPGGRFSVVAVDLAWADGVADLIERLAALPPIDLLVNNAGVGWHGSFAEQEATGAAEQIRLNCEALVAVTRAVLPSMIDRGAGGVVNVASTASFQPTPSMAVYGATKAFVLSFSEALHVEVRGAGVDVLALCPGSTQTEFFRVSGGRAVRAGRQTPEQVVETGLRALRRRRQTVVSGFGNKVGALGYRFVPRSLIARVSRRIVEGL